MRRSSSAVSMAIALLSITQGPAIKSGTLSSGTESEPIKNFSTLLSVTIILSLNGLPMMTLMV
jgi:hypothetical protein